LRFTDEAQLAAVGLIRYLPSDDFRRRELSNVSIGTDNYNGKNCAILGGVVAARVRDADDRIPGCIRQLTFRLF
jgi:hypothetical protein